MVSDSQYDPIWSKLKQNGTVSITAHRAFHPRILKAVKKRKWLDLGYKYEISPRYAVLSHTSRYAILTFYLELRTDLSTITVNQL